MAARLFTSATGADGVRYVVYKFDTPEELLGFFIAEYLGRGIRTKVIGIYLIAEEE